MLTATFIKISSLKSWPGPEGAANSDMTYLSLPVAHWYCNALYRYREVELFK
jgi:hypothetical protein